MILFLILKNSATFVTSKATGGSGPLAMDFYKAHVEPTSLVH